MLCVVIAITLDGQTNDTFKTPGAQSQQALDLLESRFPSQAGATATVVFDAPQGVADPQVQPAIQASIANLEKLPHVSSVGNLITATNEQFAGKIALVTAQYDTQAQDVGLDAYTLLQQATQPRPTRESSSRSAARSSTTRTRRRRATPTSSVSSPRSSSCCSRSGRWSRWASRSSPRCSVSASASR